ncbi:hypothetical protein [Pseudonocardia sp. GCM10023141]|uniref:hypothetical protein n=1 Tax=Pseudonocardia sp. GCM10023141 TaxID=3252653 RepID=UPI00361B6623
MDEQVLVATRRSLHGVAELVIAGPQYRTEGTIRLAVTPGGFGGVKSSLRVSGTDLVRDGGQVPLAGTYRQLGAAAGVDVGVPEGLYSDTSGVDPDETIAVDAEAAGVLAAWFANGDTALRALAPGVEPVIWPEHFDLAVTLDEVNYGVSPGDAGHPLPYAYVGPWTPREGEFWNASFGALRESAELPDAAAVEAFFAEGRRLA